MGAWNDQNIEQAGIFYQVSVMPFETLNRNVLHSRCSLLCSSCWRSPSHMHLPAAAADARRHLSITDLFPAVFKTDWAGKRAD
jgi:hypothetical protein